MNVLLTGASGFIGSHIMTYLVRCGHTVKPVDRHHGFDFRRLTSTDAWTPHLAEIDAVINCVGIIAETSAGDFELLHHHAPAALFKACAASGDIRVIQISALGADTDAITPYHRSKLAADDVLRGLDLDWFILRPSLVYGAGGRSTTLFEQLSSFPLLPLVSGGRQRIQPVHIDDLTELVLHCLSDHRNRMTIDVVGADALSLRDWLALMRRHAGRREALVIPVPYPLCLAASYITRAFSALLQPDNLRMLEAGNTADPARMTELLGHPPLDAETGWLRR